MNRRSFLKKVGTGVAVAAIAPLVLEEAVTSFSAPVTVTIGEYCDYVSFSNFAIAKSIDEVVAKAAEELGRAYALRVDALYAEAFS